MTRTPWTAEERALVAQAPSYAAAEAALPHRSPHAIRMAWSRLGRDRIGRRDRGIRGPRTPDEAAVWAEIQRVMGYAIAHQRRVDWGAVLQALRTPTGDRPRFAYCVEPGCAATAVATGRCETHYRGRMPEPGAACQVPGCGHRKMAKGLCPRHYHQARAARLREAVR